MVAKARTDRPQGSRAWLALVALLSGLLVGFGVVAVGTGLDEPHQRTAGRGESERPPSWRRVTSASGRFAVELPGPPVDDAGAIVLGAGRSVPVATRHATTVDGTTATVAELDYSAAVGPDGYDLRLGAASAVMRAGGSLLRFDEVGSTLGPAASFAGAGDDLVIQGYLVADGGDVVLLLVTAPSSAADAAAGAILRMAGTLAVA